jgi:transmembrane 9 superfamily protein 2/4
VKWEQSEHKWASRWDSYLLMTDDQIHWFSIINSLMIVLFLTGMVAMIMMRTLHADVRRYREMAENAEEAQVQAKKPDPLYSSFLLSTYSSLTGCVRPSCT